MNRLNKNLILAPIKGITDLIFRNVFAGHFSGFSSAVTPFIGGTHAKKKTAGQLNNFNPENDLMPTVPQILSNDPDEFLRLADALIERGYTGINWNLGCPHPLVTTKKKGAWLLSYPAVIDSFLKHVCPRLKGSLSVKMRLGYRYSDEIQQMLPVLDNYPLDYIIIHARTAEQMYGGKCDLDAFERCLGITSHNLIYNGDITDRKTFDELAGRFPTVSGWMIGRGALADPFLPLIITDGIRPADDDRRVRIWQFHHDLFEAYRIEMAGESHLLRRMKAVWEYMSPGFTEKKKIIKNIKKTQSVKHYLEYTEKLFS